MLRWIDPETGQRRQRSAETTIRREAERARGDLERRLAEGELLDEIGWETFRQRYIREKLASLRPKSRAAALTALNAYEELLKPRLLTDATAGEVSRFSGLLRTGTERRPAGYPPSTIAAYLRQLRAAWRWAARVFSGFRSPAIEMPRGPRRKMKGRPITSEEFERMLKAVPKIIQDRSPNLEGEDLRRAVISWRRLLRGLWLSGLRLAESMEIDWEAEDLIHPVNLDSPKKRPMLAIHAENEKGGQDRLLPMVPDFAEFLRQWPADKRRGRIFRPRLSRGAVRSVSTVSHVISAIGEEAKVVIDQAKAKFATAHDLRRSFAQRWRKRVDRETLRLLMRHESYQTTDTYYVEADAEGAADKIWAAQARGDRLGDQGQETHRAVKSKTNPKLRLPKT